MGVAIVLQQPLAVDPGINLRGRKRSVAEQFLDRAQVTAAAQKGGCKRMPQGVRRRADGQAERPTQPFHGELNDSRTEWAAAGADKDGCCRGQRMRAYRDI